MYIQTRLQTSTTSKLNRIFKESVVFQLSFFIQPVYLKAKTKTKASSDIIRKSFNAKLQWDAGKILKWSKWYNEERKKIKCFCDFFYAFTNANVDCKP